jgi:hypothetical protein
LHSLLTKPKRVGYPSGIDITGCCANEVIQTNHESSQAPEGHDEWNIHLGLSGVICGWFRHNYIASRVAQVIHSATPKSKHNHCQMSMNEKSVIPSNKFYH